MPPSGDQPPQRHPERPAPPPQPADPADRRFPPRPLVGVAAVVFRGERVLLVRRGTPPRQGEWSLPGGLQQLGETVAEAARREVREETGIDADPIGLVDVVDLIERTAPEAPATYHYTLVEMLAVWRRGEAEAGDDAADVAWFDPERVPALGLWSETARIIALARAKWIAAGRP